MKNIILSTLVLTFVMTSCNKKSEENRTTDSQTESHSKHKEAENKANTEKTQNVSIQETVSKYLQLKNALVKDDSKGAANAGKELFQTLKGFDTGSIEAKSKTEYNEIAEDAKEHAEHIGEASGNIVHQREHFVLLSKDVNDIIELLGTTQTLYQEYCPMANEGKGALWISETKEIQNPYYGSKMLDCGSVKKTM
ncbi:DUF3347 domain-containing protein [Flavobacterium sp. N502540]|uniref:DUF3347 domain-containing protein n=1 Tax=Flavobacterium sp. N502540 TaxID=2986838 RepID=UPI002224F9EB|nr:DUF3347 domain-containing protein [Flavobacterium sp. N502540]